MGRYFIIIVFIVSIFFGCNDPAIKDDPGDPPQIIIYNDTGRALIIEYDLSPYIEVSGMIPNQAEYEVENGVDIVFLSVEKWEKHE